jgi:dipeptidase E
MDDRDSGLNRRALVGGALGLALASRPALAHSHHGTPTIFATGGTFLPPEGGQPLFPRYLLSLVKTRAPRICWLGAASGEDPAAYALFQRRMTRLGCTVSHFNIFHPETLDFVEYLHGFDIVYVNGGSSRNLMALWREWGFDRALYTAWQAGVVMAGHSAGFICWFQGGLTDSYSKLLSPVKAMGFLTGSADPHFNIRADRRTRFRELIADGQLESPGLALDQDSGMLYRGVELVEVVSAKKGSGAYRLTRVGNIVEERALPVRYLG